MVSRRKGEVRKRILKGVSAPNEVESVKADVPSAMEWRRRLNNNRAELRFFLEDITERVIIDDTGRNVQFVVNAEQIAAEIRKKLDDTYRTYGINVRADVLDAECRRLAALAFSEEAREGGERVANVAEPAQSPVLRQSQEEATARLLAAAEIAEQGRPALARGFALLLEEGRRDPGALEARIAALTAALAPAEPESEHSARLPTEIPEAERYAAWSKINGRKIVKFCDEGWPAPYIKAGILSRPTVHRLDASAWLAMKNLADRGLLPERLKLPDRSAVVTEELAHVDKQALRDAARLAQALRRREHRQREK